jgi:hypothetical protein
MVVAASVALLAPSRAWPQMRSEGIREAAERVANEWRKGGAVVERAPARFLYESETMTVTLPESTDDDRGCLTIALIGARGLSFHAKVGGDDEGAGEDSRVASVAGILEMGECGEEAEPFERLRVTSDAGRGAIEIVIGRSAKPVPALSRVLPERTGGVLPPPPDAGPPPSLPLPALRAESAEMRAKTEGAKIAPRASWTAGNDGTGDAKLALQPGCHRIEVFAPGPRPHDRARRRRLDVDAEIRDEDDELLARDRTDNADARLESCVGEETASTVIFAGAPAGGEVTVTHASWPIPEHVPSLWGPAPRARMARAVLARRAGAPPEDAVGLFAGPSGATPIPIALEPGACYLAVAAVTHGHAHGLGLRVAIGARDARDERTSDDDAGVVAFCAKDQDHARLEVDARGTSLAWGLALFRLQGRIWSEP